MSQPRLKAPLWIACAVLVALLIGVNAAGMTVTAQDVSPQTSTPRPSPTGNGGNAQWTINDMTFASEYPNGGTFTVDATSSGGKITNASLFFQHNPSARSRALGKPDETSGKWVAHGISGDTPQWVAVDYYWNLTDETGNTYQTEMKHDVYTDTRREWNHAESEDIEVYWEKQLPADMGETIINAMKDRREWYYNNWGALLKHRPRAIIFDAEEDTVINEWSPGSTGVNPGFGDRVATITGGFTTQKFGAFVGIYRQSREDPIEFAYATVLHEVGHLYQYQNAGAWGSEFWMQEGDAEFNANYKAATNFALNRASQIAASGNMPPLAELGGLDAYNIGFSFFYWYTGKFGEDAHLKLAQLAGKGVRMRAAFEQITGEPFIQLEGEFRMWLGAPNAEVPTTVPEPTLFSFPSPTFQPTKTPKP